MVVLSMNKKEEKKISDLVDFIRDTKGLDLSLYRSSFLNRRLDLRMYDCKISNIEEYSALISKSSIEWNNFLKALSVNVSSFFRDSDVYSFFSKNCLEEIIKEKAKFNQRLIRVWSAGCSYGEEPYSLAICLREALRNKNFVPKVWATDVDPTALVRAAQGEYQQSSLKEVEKSISKKYFTEIENNYFKVNEDVKKIVSFKQHNIFSDEPLKYMDVIFFRNVRIYFEAKQAEKILKNLYKSLRKGGYLVMGKTELLPVALKNLFTPVKSCYRIFQKVI